MNDITALMATMKAAAEKATPGAYVVGHNDINRHGVLSSVFVCQEYKGIAGGVVAECHVNCLTKNDEQVYANAEFIAATHPANVLALVEALEKAQKLATQQGNIACALLDEVNQLRRTADDKAPELRAQLVEADGELVKLQNRVEELESEVFEWLETEISAIDSWYRGTPSYEREAGWMKDAALGVVKNARKAFGIQVIEGEGQ